jgi:hypothetical protein
MARSVEVIFMDDTTKVYKNAEAEHEGEFLKIYHGERYSDRKRGEVRIEYVKSWENIQDGEDEEGKEDIDPSTGFTL